MKRTVVAVTILLASLVVAAPAVASTRPEPRQTSMTQVVNPPRVIERPSEGRPDATEPESRRFCAANPDHIRCQVRSADPNVRSLIWRLINAGEWRQLFHLLQRLGII